MTYSGLQRKSGQPDHVTCNAYERAEPRSDHGTAQRRLGVTHPVDGTMLIAQRNRLRYLGASPYLSPLTYHLSPFTSH